MPPPPSAHSSAAESSAFPTMAFKACSANTSIAPPRGTPDERECIRPVSCTVRYGGARVTVITTWEQIGLRHRRGAGAAGPATDRTSPCRCCRLCASPREYQVDTPPSAHPRLRRCLPAPGVEAETDGTTGALGPTH